MSKIRVLTVSLAILLVIFIFETYYFQECEATRSKAKKGGAHHANKEGEKEKEEAKKKKAAEELELNPNVRLQNSHRQCPNIITPQANAQQ